MDPITTLINAIFGGVSAAAAVGGLFLQIRHTSTFDTLQKELTRRANSKFSKLNGAEKQLIAALNHGMIILRPLRYKLVVRFVISLIIIAAIFLGIGGDFPGSVGDAVSFEFFDIALILVQLMAGLINRTPYFLDADEKDFLENLSALHSQFHQAFVIPAIQDFNREALALPWMQEGKRRERVNEDRLRRLVREEWNKIQRGTEGVPNDSESDY